MSDFASLSNIEQQQYIEILESFLKLMKNEDSEFLKKMETYPKKIVKYFTQTPIPDKVLKHYGLCINSPKVTG